MVRRRQRLAAIALVASLWQAAASAGDFICEAATTSAEMRACANQRYREADAALNAIYQRLTAQLPARRRERLRAAQQAWIAFRDRNASFIASAVEQGTQYPILEVSALAHMTEQRAEELEQLLDD